MTGPNPVDHGKPGSKIHVLSDRARVPLSVAMPTANTNDSDALKPLLMAIPAIKSRRGPRRRKPGKPHADKAYDQTDLPAWVRGQDIKVRIARKGTESNKKLGKHRWVIERSIASLFGYRRLDTRYDRYANHFYAFLALAHLIAELKNSPTKTRSKGRSQGTPIVRITLTGRTIGDGVASRVERAAMERHQYSMHRTVFVVDVEGFGDRRRTNSHQVAVRAALYEILRRSFDEIGRIGATRCSSSCPRRYPKRFSWTHFPGLSPPP